MKKIALVILLLVLASGLVGCPWRHHHRHDHGHYSGYTHHYGSR